jgi:teichuronic acid biosynthesis glycosyltransferase TuaG
LFGLLGLALVLGEDNNVEYKNQTIEVHMTNPIVSILMPFHGACPTLQRSVESVLQQSRTDWELFLIDDGASASVAAQARRLSEKDSRIKYLKTMGGQGAAAARNHGLSMAQARYIGFLDSDDRWHPQKLSKQLDLMIKTDTALSYTAYERHLPDGTFLCRVAAQLHLGYCDMLGPNLIGCLTVIYDRKHLGHQPMPLLPLQHDYALWLRLLRQEDAVGLDEVLAYYCVTPGSLSSNKFRAIRDIWRVWNCEENLPWSTCLVSLCRYGLYSIRNRVLLQHNVLRALIKGVNSKRWP